MAKAKAHEYRKRYREDAAPEPRRIISTVDRRRLKEWLKDARDKESTFIRNEFEER